MGDGVVLVERRHRTILRANPAFERLFGYRSGADRGAGNTFPVRRRREPPARWSREQRGLLIQQPEFAQQRFTRLRELGVRLLPDDFGPGCSSLGYLRRLRFDKLKVDRSFFEEVASNPEHAILVKATIDMARALRMETMAEGVESMAQLRQMVSMGCSAVQGWIYSEALDAQAAGELLERRYLPVP